MGSQMLAAWQAVHPAFSRLRDRRQPRVHRARIWWQRLHPSHSRPPQAFPVVAGIAVPLVGGHADMALWTLLTLGGYLRPGEATSLRGMDVVPPFPPTTRVWSLLVRPAEPLPTKNKDFKDLGDSMLWEILGLMWMTKHLRVWRRQKDKVTWRLAHASRRPGLPHVVPYSLRHSGASRDAVGRARALQEVQKRCRWRGHRRLVRYEKAGCVGAKYTHIPPAP